MKVSAIASAMMSAVGMNGISAGSGSVLNIEMLLFAVGRSVFSLKRDGSNAGILIYLE